MPAAIHGEAPATIAAETFAPTAEYGLFEGGAVVAGEGALDVGAAAVGVAPFAGVVAAAALPVATAVVLYYHPEWGAALPCAEDGTICGDMYELEEQERLANRQGVNLDTSAIIAATQMTDQTLNAYVNAYLVDKRIVVTDAARAELFAGPIKKAGPIETAAVGAFLARVQRIPDDPLPKVLNIAGNSERAVDRIIFGRD